MLLLNFEAGVLLSTNNGIKHDRYLLSLFVLMAGKGPDPFYARLDALVPTKKVFYAIFSICIYI